MHTGIGLTAGSSSGAVLPQAALAAHVPSDSPPAAGLVQVWSRQPVPPQHDAGRAADAHGLGGALDHGGELARSLCAHQGCSEHREVLFRAFWVWSPRMWLHLHCWLVGNAPHCIRYAGCPVWGPCNSELGLASSPLSASQGLCWAFTAQQAGSPIKIVHACR